MNYYRSKEFCSKIGVSLKTLERLETSGVISPIRKGRLRYYTDEHVANYFEQKEEMSNTSRKIICYYRVSTNSQKNDLINQKKMLEEYIVSRGIECDEYIKDIGSGLNYKRKGLLYLIQTVLSHEVKEVIITHKDRLTRFSFELLEWLFDLYGCKITVINLPSTSLHEEMVEDLMTIIHVFSCRLYGLRKYKDKIKKEVKEV